MSPQRESRLPLARLGPNNKADVGRYLLAEKAFERIDVYEQRSRVGGVWDYSPEQKTPDDLPVPSVTPHAGLARPKWRQSGTRKALGGRVEEDSLFLSPLYDRLETNIPRTSVTSPEALPEGSIGLTPATG